MRIIAVDRPGYGRSSPGSRPTLLSHAPDAAALLDQLGVDRCVVGGISDGGAVSMALAVALGDRVSHVVPINSPVSPFDSSFEAVTPEARATIPELTRGVARQVFGAMREDPIPTMTAAPVMASADRALLSDPEHAAFVAASIKEGLMQGLDAVLEEMAAMYDLPWGFDWGSPLAPVSLFVAEHDMSIGAARLLAARYPKIELFEIRGAGHLGGHTDAVWRDVMRAAFA